MPSKGKGEEFTDLRLREGIRFWIATNYMMH